MNNSNLTATLQTKNGMYYCVISYKDKETNKWKLKWKTTKVLAKQGNKKKAKDTFPAIIENFKKELEEKEKQTKETEKQGQNSYEKRIEEYKNKTFLEFIKDSIEEFKTRIAETTYDNWISMYSKRTSNYFGIYENLEKIYNEDVERPQYYEEELKIVEVTQFDIEDFYSWLYRCGLKGSTVLKYHVLLGLVMKRAIRLKIFTLETNPMKDIEKPTVAPYTADYYTAQELNVVFDIVKGEKIEMPVVLASFYALRRSEAIGIKWSAIDFVNKFITIKHTVTKVTGRGNNQVIHSKEATKNEDIRTLPLLPEVEQKLIEHRQRIEENKKFYGNDYYTQAEDYVCVDEQGALIRPDYVTSTFRETLKKHSEEIKRIRFHSLRHSVRFYACPKQCKSGSNTSLYGS